MPGCGKSTVGKLLARRLDCQYNDSDLLIEEKLGGTIADYFFSFGERSFRDFEQAILAEFLSGDFGVLATGGGAVLREENRAAFAKSRAHIVYLQASALEISHRIRPDGHRPLLNKPNSLGTLEEMLRVRASLYESVATLVVHSGGVSVRRVVDLIIKEIDFFAADAAGRF